jgi:hypothetical protein
LIKYIETQESQNKSKKKKLFTNETKKRAFYSLSENLFKIQPL